jgi:RHS repeat-associated protein
MSNTSGVSSQVISLPQGGGALQGIGEKFAPDLHTGTGNFTVPIALPPGRNGFQPQLSLGYSTGSGNGPFGFGWSTSIPGVRRKTSKGIPQYLGADVFILSGAEDLVQVPLPGNPQGISRYQPRTEGLFAHIDHHHDSENDYWEVRSKDGLTSLYGAIRPTDAPPAWRDPATIVDPDPDKPDHIFAWNLTSTTDPFGNRIEYRYERDATPQDGPHHWDQLYLAEIRYIDYGDPVSPQFLVQVAFQYEQRPDPFSDYRAGFEIRTVRRCTAVAVSTHAGSATPTRTYHLVYLDQRGLPPDQLPRNGASLLSQVQVEGHDGAVSEWLPPLEFGYSRFDPEGRRFIPMTGYDLPPGSLAHPEYELADLTGDGLPDILQMNGAVRYWRNLGDGRFDLPREMADAPAGLHLGDKGVQMIDANGDGRIDLLATTEGLTGYFPLRFGAMWDRKSFQRYRVAPSFDLKDPEVRLVDLDGDGVTDAIRSDTRLECFFNDPHDGWTSSRWVERRSLDVFPNVNFSDPRVKWADMTGDGLQDIVLVHERLIEYWPALGRGNWGKRIAMRNSPHFPYGYDPKRILFGDVDGDGAADIVYVEDTRVTLWINHSGNSWSDPIEIQGTPPVSDMDAVRLADMLGSGIGGVLWSADVGQLGRDHMYFLDFTGGVKPYVLNEMDNHMGSTTRVGYAPSTRFYLADQRRRDTQWKTSLPFPVQVVARVEVIDAISGGKLTTEYSYHHGYWDGAEREFLGFGRVDHRDTETFDDYHAAGLHPADRAFACVATQHFSPPTETRTWFHQGAVGDEFGGWGESDLSQEYWQEPWPGDPRHPRSQALSRPHPVEDLLKGLPRRAKRDAIRTLRGRVLRTELYALDGSSRQDRPYTVTEHLHGVMPLPLNVPLPPQADDWRQRVFFPYTLAERTTQWERGDDPMTQFTFAGAYDAYGLALTHTAIAVPRGRNIWAAATGGEPYLATHTATTYAQRDDAQRYVVDRVASTTTYEILNRGNAALFETDGSFTDFLQQAIGDGSVARRIVGQGLNYYDGSAFQGRWLGDLGDYGALVRTETLILTAETLHEAYKSGSAVLTPPEEPPYLTTGGAPTWTADYPQEFRDLLPPLAGYVHHQVYGANEGGYFAATEQRRYDFHVNPGGVGRGLITVRRDPLGHDTSVAYDAPYDLLPIQVTDAAGLVTKADYDYRVFQPKQVTEPNGNLTSDTFTPLGLLDSTAIIGKNGEGDTPDAPSTRLEYDFLAFANRSEPIFVRSIRRVHHVTDTSVSLPERDETIETVEYSDGHGRLLQTRTQAEDVLFGDATFGDAGLSADQAAPVADAVGHLRAATDPPNVVVSGWQIYDNKGQVVEKYEPFYATGWDYAAATDSQRGQKVTMRYDPRGHVIRTVNPDGSEQLDVFGVPPDLSIPDQFTPTAWETYIYDTNDNAGRTHPASSTRYKSHWNTPASSVVDALGRTVQTVARNGQNPGTEWFTTRSTYDIRGNLQTVTDPLGRIAFRHLYDLAPKARTLRIEQLDAGLRRIVLDAAGNAVEQRDSKGSHILHGYDMLNRPLRLWARDGTGQPLTLREQLIYGDSPDAEMTAAQAVDANLLGKLYRHYDEAGLLTFSAYDFKGNVLEKSRRVISDAAMLAVFNPPPLNWQVPVFQVNWQPLGALSLDQYAGGLLDTTVYQTSITYDALNRIVTMRFPQAVDGARKQLAPHYNCAGALERVEMDGAIYVAWIAYNAKGQRTLIAYGNGVMTRYAYDPQTLRLARMRTDRFTSSTPYTYHAADRPLQDSAYAYDLAGNILSIQDRTPGSGVLNNPDATQAVDQALAQLLVSGDALKRRFSYDPLYRLLAATGRECSSIPRPRPWTDDPRCGFNSGNQGTPNQDNAPSLTTAYQEEYAYDPAGNMLSLTHRNNGAFWTRSFGMGGLTPQQWVQQWPTHQDPKAIWANPPGNQLTHVSDNSVVTVQTHVFDANGNLTQETSSRYFEWDHSDRMLAFRTQVGTAEPSMYAKYLYDASGQRVKKLVRKQGGQVEATVYVDGMFEHHRRMHGGMAQENTTLHVMDNQNLIALARVGTAFPDDAAPATTYHIGDHLASSSLALDNGGAWVNREEYTPYGETIFGSYGRKRYRFTGKERDDESGLNYHSARYYAPWLARWVNCDPSPTRAQSNLYAYVRDNPVRRRDSNGMEEEDIMKTAIQHHPTLYEFNLKVAVARFKDVTFGRSTPFTYDETYWNMVIPTDPREKKAFDHVLQLKQGIRPSEAIHAMLSQKSKWRFDCAEFVQVVHLSALLYTLGPTAFDRQFAGKPFFLKPQLSSGVNYEVRFTREFPVAPMARIEPGVRFSSFEHTNRVDHLLKGLPIGSRVAWPHPLNALVIGQNEKGEALYAVQGYGRKIYTRKEIEGTLLRGDFPLSVFISEIERYKTPQNTEVGNAGFSGRVGHSQYYSIPVTGR